MARGYKLKYVRVRTQPSNRGRYPPCLNRAGRVPSGHNRKYSRMAWRGPCGWAHGGAAAAAEWLARWTMVWGAAAARGRPRTRRLARASPRGDTSADEALPNRPGPSLRRVCAPTSTGRQPVHHDLDGHASTLVMRRDGRTAATVLFAKGAVAYFGPHCDLRWFKNATAAGVNWRSSRP